MKRLCAIFSTNLVRLRSERNLSQDELAASVGVSRITIGRYESGEFAPSFESIEKIADFLNVNPSDFFQSDETKERLVLLDNLLTEADAARVRRYESTRRHLRHRFKDVKVFEIVKEHGRTFISMDGEIMHQIEPGTSSAAIMIELYEERTGKKFIMEG